VFDSWQGRGRDFFLFDTASRPALGPTLALIQRMPATLSLGVKWPGRYADHLPPSSAEGKNARRYISTPPHVFKAWCSIKHRDNLTLTLECDGMG